MEKCKKVICEYNDKGVCNCCDDMHDSNKEECVSFINKMEGMLTATKVSQYLDISVQTLTNWYKWQEHCRTLEQTNLPYLPAYKQAGERAPRYWDEKDLPILQEFKNKIPKGRGGVMGQYNAKFWGDRGKRALTNKSKK